MLKRTTHTLCFLLLSALFLSPASAANLNGFSLEGSLVDSDHILRGGPPRDGIPALSRPKFIEAEDNIFLEDGDRVLGIAANGVAKAYPVKILNWHEVVNDSLSDMPLVITYCPLCGTGMAFSRVIEGEELHFGVSGLLYNSDVLLYDRQSQSLWSQIMGRAVTGVFAGTRLEQIPLQHTSWQNWRRQHPHTLVLSKDTGYVRNYNLNPYADYAFSERLYFPVENEPEGEIHLKETVMGVSIAGSHKAYPFSRLEQAGKRRFEDSVGGAALTILWDPEASSAMALDETGRELPTVQAFWFAWCSFHPETEIFGLPWAPGAPPALAAGDSREGRGKETTPVPPVPCWPPVCLFGSGGSEYR